MINKLEKFTYSVYTTLLRYLKTKWEIVKFIDAYNKPPHLPFLLLRHDMDSFTDSALNLAKIEKEEGVNSTFFYLCSSPLYNIHDPKVVDSIREIVSLGHDIGLHYDSSIYLRYSKTILDGLNSEAAYLEEIIGTKIKVISQHDPRVKEPILESRYIEAYKDLPFDCYISDARRQWSTGLNNLFTKDTPKAVHMVIHPPLWSEQFIDNSEITDHVFDFIINKILDEKEKRLALWRKYVNG